MAVAALITLGEYLSSSYDPDCEFVDGLLLGRNAGELDHSFLQGTIYDLLRTRGLFAFVELRVQVNATRFRIPDVLAMRTRPSGRFIEEPPYIVVEILSREDRATHLNDKIEDYLAMGVPNIWVVDPRRRTITGYTNDGARLCTGRVETSDRAISIPLEEIFSDIPDTGSE